MNDFIEMAKECSKSIEALKTKFKHPRLGSILDSVQVKIVHEIKLAELELKRNSDHVQITMFGQAPTEL